MIARQYRVLYREFLFRMVDRELLSTHAKGDASQLLLQIVTLLVFLSICFSVPALFMDGAAPAPARLMFAWNVEHFLIATTMLVMGVLAVLSWDSMFPGHRDVLVLAPLPIRAHTILLARLGAVMTALSVAVIALHLVAGLVWPLALNATAGGLRSWMRVAAAYWFTMLAAAGFIVGLAMSVQGIAASLLPRRIFLRLSSLLQLALFCLIVGVYLLQPMAVRPGTVLAAQQNGLFGGSPSLWFLGLFQQLSGSPALAPLPRSAWAGLGLVVAGAALAYTLSYFRTLTRIAEEPDIARAAAGARWLPSFGDSLRTAIVQFSIRTLFRGTHHRVILSFYWGIGFALVIVFMKSPRGQQLAEVSGGGGWREASVPLLVSSMVMMAVAVLAARVAFSMPRDLPANWIFRVLPSRPGSRYVGARWSACMILSAVPVWAVSALVFFWIWPWRPALGHLVALGILGLILVEMAVAGTPSIPFTCSYLPGKSRAHLVIYVVVTLLFPATIAAGMFERDALQDPMRYAAMLAVLVAAWAAVKSLAWFGHDPGAQVEFEETPEGQALTLDVWDARFVP